ncbi:5'-nucleotidase C-terminal domain-containing protein [Brevibacterium yomogidense]|uniref:5'-nucleotidase C-terminal domain-containing protein n=1 Tax=Brevibacterium yomogidense TaxID=946573 RepID=UPI0018DF4E1C|nr:5'-nucleotidase C-terminal domain-containing protein [Brevibacterium yomogidense]
MKKTLLRGVVAGAAATGMVLPLAALPAFGEAPTGTQVQLLNITDFHGRIAESGHSVASVVERERAAFDGETAFLTSGDNIGASTYVSSSQEDQPTLDVLNAIGTDSSATGNHEFDRGYEDLRDRVGASADFPHLGANVYKKGTTEVADGIDAYTIVEQGDVRIGVIGAVTEETATLVSPGGIDDIEFGDPVTAINDAAAELEALPEGEKPDVTVLTAHLGPAVVTDIDSALKSNEEFNAVVTGADASIDAMFFGHSHLRTNLEAPVPGDEDRTRPVVQSGNYGDTVGKVTLTSEGDGNWTVDEQELIDTADQTFDSPVVDEVDSIVADAIEKSNEIGSEVVGTIDDDITRAFNEDGSENRGGESTLGNLVADALTEGVEMSQLDEADFGMTNPGGLRTDLKVDDIFGDEEPGEVTVGELNAVLPFANDHGVVTLTGNDVIQLIEEQWQPDGASRSFLHMGLSEELDVVYDSEAPRGEHVVSVKVNGEDIDPDAEYRVATLSFLASGGDNFSAFANGEFEQSGLTDFDVWENYFQERDVVEADPQERQADFALDVINTEELAATFSYEGGETIEVEQGEDADLTFTTEATRLIDGPFELALELPDGFSADLSGVEAAHAASAPTVESALLEQIAEGTTATDVTVTPGDDVEAGDYTVTATIAADPEHAWWDDNPLPVTRSLELDVTVTAAPDGGDDGDDDGNGDGNGDGDGDDGNGDGGNGGDDGQGDGDRDDNAGDDDNGKLPRTGAELGGILGLAAALVAAGGAALAASRKRSKGL